MQKDKYREKTMASKKAVFLLMNKDNPNLYYSDAERTLQYLETRADYHRRICCWCSYRDQNPISLRFHDAHW